MRRVFLLINIAFMLVVFITAGLVAQQGGKGRPQRPDRSIKAPQGSKQNSKEKGNGEEEAKKPKPLPSDPRLLAFHKDFVIKATKLAQEYERNHDWGKARSCYEEILKLVPNEPQTQQRLEQILEKEATADRKVMEIFANRDWQDTGVVVQAGKPVRIRASGTWTFKMSHNLSPSGMQIPKELRDFNLGALVGVVNAGDPEAAKPFLVGEEYEFTATENGRLLLRMYDSDVSDNQGKITVEVTGTFGTGKMKDER